MRDPVALAYSGRIDEARAAAVAQAASDDDFLASQGLEALGVLGEQHGVRSDPALDDLLVRRATERGPLVRRAYEAATALESRHLEGAAVARYAAGDVTWELLRYTGELPSHALALALAGAWGAVPARLLDQALLTTRVLPAATREECAAWGERILAHAGDDDDDVRGAAFEALWTWRPDEGADACARALEDRARAVRLAAARALAAIDADRLAARAAELEEDYPELAAEVPLAARVRHAERRR